MNLIADGIIRFKKWIVALFALAFVFLGVSALTVHINYNMMDYLPDNANSTKAISIMKENFGEGIANVRVMVPNLTIMDAVKFKQELKKIDGVSNVMWLDDVVDIRQPLEVLDQSTVKAYYKDKAALFSVTVADGKEQTAVKSIYKIAGGNSSLDGNAVTQAHSQSMAVSEAMKSIVVLGALIVLILIIATNSWFEPVIYLITVGIAVIMNLGANFVAGQISYVTLAVAPVLQLAVSLDYAVFLNNSFEANRKKTNNAELAMKWALKDSFKAVFGSAMSTLFGFFALLFMNFKIGPDMGVSLVRGVIISYLAVVIFLPALTLCLYRVTDRLKHRSFLPDFTKFGNAMVRFRIPMFLVVLALIYPCYLAQQNNTFLYGAGDSSLESRIGQDEKKIKDKFGDETIFAMLVPVGNSTSEAALCEKLDQLDFVTSVTSYTTMVSNKIPKQYLSEDVRSDFYSDKYARIIINTTLNAEGQTAFSGVKQIRKISAEYYPKDVYLCGEAANMYDMMETVTTDNERVDLITVVAIFFVLLISFRSLMIPLVLIATIKTAIWINMAVPYFSGGEMSYIGYMVVSAVMMGSAIDYAILMTDHYMEVRKKKPALAAMKETVGSCTKAMLVSSMIMAIAGFALAIMSSESVVKVLGMLLGRGAVIALLLCVVFLPAFILLFDRLISLFTIRADFFKEEIPDSQEDETLGEAV